MGSVEGSEGGGEFVVVGGEDSSEGLSIVVVGC